MDIINLKITNFLAIGDAPLIELKDKGLVLIQGVNEDDTSATSNGVGKSSIADALCWALYGQTARDESGDAVVNKVAKKNCSVRVSLQDGTTVYRITRYRKDKEFKNQTVVEAASPDESGTGGVWFDMSKGTEKETQEVINGIMGCTLDVFMGAIYAGQEVAPDLPKMTDKQLKLLIEEAAGVERLETAYEIARKKLGQAKDRLAITIAHKESAENRLASSKTSLASKELDAESFDRYREVNSEAYKEKANAHKASLVGFLTQMKGIDHVALTERSTALASTLSGHSDLLKKRNELFRGVTQAESAWSAANLQAVKAVKSVDAAKEKLDNAAEEIKKPCTECGKPGDEHDLDRYKSVVRNRAIELANEAKSCKEAAITARKVFEAKQAELEAFEKTIPDVSEVSAEQAKITAQLTEYANLKLMASQEKAKMDAQMALANSALTETNPHASAVEMLKEQISKVTKELEGYVEGVLKDEAEMIVFDNVAKVFSPAGVRAHILDTVTPFLNEQTGDYLSALSDGNISAVWTTLATTAKGDLKEKFCIEVSNDKGAESFKGLSGGEKRKVRLATMLALQDLVASRATKPIGLWMGDEIDDALDSAGLERLMGILERKARERGTVLVISHNDLNCWIDASVTVTKSGGLSTIEGYLCP